MPRRHRLRRVGDPSFLVEHSLVTADDRPYGEPRSRMLETVRDYAVEQLRQAGRSTTTRCGGCPATCAKCYAASPGQRRWGRASPGKRAMDAELTASVPCCAGPWNRTMRSSYCRSQLLHTDTGGGTAYCARCSTSPIARRHCPHLRGCLRDLPRCCSGRAAHPYRPGTYTGSRSMSKLPRRRRSHLTTTGCGRRVCSAWPSRCHRKTPHRCGRCSRRRWPSSWPADDGG